MQFAFTDQQTEFRDAVRQVLAKECTTDDLRAAYEAPRPRSPRWTVLAEMGVVGLTVPEDHGGLGLGLVDLVLLLEESGRVALPEPLVESTALAAPLLAELDGRGGSAPGPRAAWLEGIAAGSVAAAVAEPSAGAVVAGPSVGAGRWPEPTVPTSWSCSPPVTAATAPEIHLVAPGPGDGDPGALPRPHPAAGRPGWTPTPETLAGLGSGRRFGHPADGGPGRGGHRRPAARAERTDDHHDRRVRQGAPPVREAHRELPGRQAPVGRRPGQAWSSPGRWSTPRPGPSTRASPPVRGRRPRPRPTPRKRPPRRPGWPCRSTGPSATPGSATSTCSSSGRGPCPRRGVRPPTTASGSWPRSPPTLVRAGRSGPGRLALLWPPDEAGRPRLAAESAPDGRTAGSGRRGGADRLVRLGRTLAVTPGRQAPARSGKGEGVDGHPVVLGRPRGQIGPVDHHGQRTRRRRARVPLDGDDGAVRPDLHDQADVERGRRRPRARSRRARHPPAPVTAVGGRTAVLAAAQS